MKNVMQKIYSYSPDILQTLFLNAYAYKINRQRFGKALERTLRWLEGTEKWSLGELVMYQEERLRVLVSHAYETVPFHNARFKSLKLVPKDIQSIKDLVKLPIITKSDLKKDLKSYLSCSFKDSSLYHGHTSGTTGSPLDVYWDQGMVLMNNAMDWRQKRWAGFVPGDRHAVVLGRVVVPIQKKNPPFWRMNYVHNQLWLSAFHLSPRNLPYYLEELTKFKPKFIEGYPSTLFILAKFLDDNGRCFPLDAVLTSAETLFPYQRELIEKAFECQVFDFYGMAERVVFATECRFHGGKHLNLEYGITEIVDKDGAQVNPGEAGKLIGTSLHNFGMPMIRYQTSDVSSIRVKPCACGLSHPLIEPVTTKAEDIIVTPEGKLISPSVLTHPFKPQKNIVESQIIQNRIDSITIKIVKNEKFVQEECDALLSGLHERLGNGLELNVEFVDEIPREKSGKFRWVISNMATSYKFQ